MTIHEYMEKCREGEPLSLKKLKRLREILVSAADSYYNSGEMTLSDDEYDLLRKTYDEHVENYEGVEPIHQGAAPKSGTLTVEHGDSRLMGSLGNVFDMKELNAWVGKRLRELSAARMQTRSSRIMSSIKYDGCSLGLTFKKGVLSRAYTRGQDGIGKNVTDLFSDFEIDRNFVEEIGGMQWLLDERVEVKCEVIMTWSDFDKFAPKYQANTGKAPANPRTSVSGILGKKSGAEKYRKYLTIVVLDIHCKSLEGTDRVERAKILHGVVEAILSTGTIGIAPLEFHEHPASAVLDSGVLGIGTGVDDSGFGSVEQFYDHLRSLRSAPRESGEALDYMADGLVVEFTSEVEREALGSRESDGKFLPSYAIALKFPSKSAVTKLLAVEFDLSNSASGRVTPVAVIEPTEIEGKIYKRVSLANFDRLREEDFRIGGEILLTIRGDVLGYVQRIVRVDEDHLEGIKIPTECPVCHYELEATETGVWLKCPNSKCENKITGKVLNYLRKIRVKGIADSALSDLAKRRYATNIVELYELFLSGENAALRKKLSGEEGWGKLRVEGCTTSLQERQTLNPYELLGAMNWPGAGRTVMQRVCAKYSIDRLLSMAKGLSRDAFVADLSANVDGVDIVLGRTIHAGLNDDSTTICDLLRKGYVMLTGKEKRTVQAPGKVLTVVVTGALARWSREDLKSALEELGHKVVGSVTSKTDYLVTNDPNSGTNKNKDAAKLGVAIVTETQFYKIVGL